MNKQKYDVVIIGGGPAGYSAALYCARSALSVLVLEKLSAGGQMATTGIVENYPGFEEGIDGFDLGEKMQRQAERFGAETGYAGVESADLTAQPKVLHTDEGDIEAETVVIATGAYPRELGLPNESGLRGRGVAYCATCDGMMYKGKDVIIVGGGNSAIADALYLEKICKSVTLIHRREELRASKVYAGQLENSTIRFVWNSRVKEILADNKVSGAVIENLKTKETQVIAAQGLFVAIGRIPDTAVFQGQLEVNKAGYIVADETTRTSIPGVFAIGDVRDKPLRQIVTAVSDGAVASKFVDEFLAGLPQ
ncbi:thioredoxin-disulfide reductase [[Clostridium] innocuum]|uniref:thioredoxin-disulfide reductase n=1 Tax=Clostridium innocuum TaxID=1522 RepID=UPI000D6A8449|nr:thioredoxin-disulfide reductase [[Clostridium] innocuum]PWJ16361.1 thioredoxin reductase (NADPH) [[Clostridium] innocuum]SSA43603.1 thioredoxin reductase (NADPH) [[Clostridium] innocuum]